MVRADAYYGRALELLPAGHPGRASVLIQLGRAALFVGRNDDAECLAWSPRNCRSA
jgi:hypothetical protein